jgi:hypothetical protein
MPSNSVFVQSGYNLDRNEAVGDWIACRAKEDASADTCRVTDAKGDVIYQGDFLPVDGGPIVLDSQIKVAAEGEKRDLWVNGPAEGGPVPVIPLASGQVLVPADDTAALADRWRMNPDELRRVQGRL